MLKLMIVDDESLFREALRKTIDWRELGYEVICEAENGIDALEKIAQFRPHVVLADINMPFMDGIELAAEVKQNGLDICFIIITGYEEFAYARQAIEVGVENYLLKPVDERELMKLLAAVKKRIDGQLDDLKKQIKVYKPLLKEMLLGSLLQGTRLFASEEWRQLKESLAIDPDDRPYQVIAIEIDGRKEWSQEDKRLWAFAVSNIMRDLLEADCVFEICSDHQHVCAVIHIKEPDAGWPVDLVQVCGKIRGAVLKYLKLDLTIGISNTHQGFEFLPSSYEDALYAIGNRHMFGDNKVIRYGDIIVSNETALRIYSIEQRQRLLMAARLKDAGEVEGVLEEVFGEIRKANASIELAKNKCLELVSTYIEYVEGTGNEIRRVFGDDESLSRELKEKKSLEEWESWIKSIYRKALRADLIHAGQGMSKTVEQAKKYIDQNLGRFDLKIDDIARHVYIGYGRLCELFKKETGVTINTYITEARIQRAKKLIDEGHHNVSAVSALVGYADANYFGKCFKKKYRLAPAKYIDNLLSR